jgi:4-hydroxy-tetrahydrodipicolinate synthase
MTLAMMQDPQINGAGVISVASNIAPKAVTEMVQFLEDGKLPEAENLLKALDPLFNLVTIITKEETPYGEVVCRARNPLGIKTLMAVLGMPAGGCRQPLGKMTQNGLETVLSTARKVQNDNPEILKPIADFFNVDIEDRINNPSSWRGLFYEEY